MRTNHTNISRTNRGALRIVAFIVGSFSLLFGLLILVISVPEVILAAPGPNRMSLAHAAKITSGEKQYVIIEDGMWDCASISYSNDSRTHSIIRHTDMLLTDNVDPKRIVVWVRMSGKMACADFETLEPTGYLERMSDGVKQKLLEDNRLAPYLEVTEFLEICGYCGLEYSLTGVGIGGFYAIPGLGFLIWGFRRPPLSEKERILKERKQMRKEQRMRKRQRLLRQKRRFGFFGYKAKDLSQEPKKKKRKPIRWFLGGEANPFQDSPPDDLG